MPIVHKVKQGDSIASIALEHGLFEETVWEDPANAELRELRKDPNVLLPGDEVHVMDVRPREESRGAEARHRFKRHGVPARLKFRLLEAGEARADVDCRIEIDGALQKGTTDAHGELSIWVPPDAKKGTLYVGEDEEYPLSIGHLDPVDEESGARARLTHLGHLSAPDVPAPDLSEAVIAFQNANKLEPTGELDEATCERLTEVHGT